MKIHWDVAALHTATLEREDGRILTFTVAWDTPKQKYVVIAIEGGTLGEDVLADHAHANLGVFDEEKDAKKACEDYGKVWLGGADAEACDCEEIVHRSQLIGRGVYGGQADPNRCVCADEESGPFASPHTHYDDAPNYPCARCDCKEYRPAEPRPAEPAEYTPWHGPNP